MFSGSDGGSELCLDDCVTFSQGEKFWWFQKDSCGVKSSHSFCFGFEIVSIINNAGYNA